MATGWRGYAVLGQAGVGELKRQSLWFLAPGQVEIREESLPSPRPGQVLVRTLVSAISAGTEMLVYRGQTPGGMAADVSIAALSGSLDFPLKYGYACVGRVEDVAGGSQAGWDGRLVFAFNPHETRFWVDPADLLTLPADLDLEDAVFLPNMETAVNFLHDGCPLLGERVLVLGQGVVGLLTTALLARMPLALLATADGFPMRRHTSIDWGAHRSLDPTNPVTPAQLAQLAHPNGFDLVYELSGNPAALDTAITQAGFGGRIVIGSWYGTKRSAIDLGSVFHRNRLSLISSQVSSIAPELRGRWDKERRFALALDTIQEIRPARLISHRFPFSQATQVYDLLDSQPQDVLQTLLVYPPEA
ncbi:MAG: zinc-binding alcohol dehydrogenase [Caldilineales bacterium]|nr:zinc-binding alcohol dehydrogenase [Caldilineales bacterium]